ncbi:MAG: NAD(P)H-hydrate epimerase [Candidatus Omnitrophica bacterium]|nr:NAD(P)H-hydrate epimerase [Candidatus Omnitrophota bacterium]
MKRLVLSREEIQRIEKETVEKFGISNLILMENAGRESFYVIKRMFKNIKNKDFSIFCGKGNNGGDGFVLARYLFNNFANVKVFYFGNPEDFTDISFFNFKILENLKVDIISINDLKLSNLELNRNYIFVDAILGIGIKYEIGGKMKEIIEYINDKENYKISIDIPSGLDADTGEIYGVCIKSDLTISMGFLKKGFFINKGPEYTGKIKVVDIGFPKYYYEK